VGKYTLLVLTNSVAGREDEFNDWYTNQHVPDILRIPGFVAAKRFRIASEQVMAGQPKWKYLALYEVETDDLKGALADMVARGGGPAMPISDALDVEGALATIYQAI